MFFPLLLILTTTSSKGSNRISDNKIQHIFTLLLLLKATKSKCVHMIITRITIAAGGWIDFSKLLKVYTVNWKRLIADRRRQVCFTKTPHTFIKLSY